MTIDTSKKHRLRDFPESEVQLFPQEPGSKYIQGRYRFQPVHKWTPAEWTVEGKHVFSGGAACAADLELIPAPPTVKSEGFWLAVDADGRIGPFLPEHRDEAEGWANVGSNADLDYPQGWLKYIPPMEYEAGSIIDPREEG